MKFKLSTSEWVYHKGEYEPLLKLGFVFKEVINKYTNTVGYYEIEGNPTIEITS